MKSLLDKKLHQTTSNTIFFFFSKFFKIMVHLKCIKHFIKHASLMMFEEVFDTLAPVFSVNPPPTTLINWGYWPSEIGMIGGRERGKSCLKWTVNKKWRDWFELGGINGFASTFITLFIMNILLLNALCNL